MWQAWVEAQWQQKSWLYYSLWPLSLLFAGLAQLRRFGFNHGWLKTTKLTVPVIVVGNISVGGVGKTPVVLWLAHTLMQAGFRPGIISRGYGGQHTGLVLPESAPALVGDEPVLLATRAGCPVWVDRNRVRAGQALLQAKPEVNVIISDDGMQHYALQRDIEIAVVHAKGLGNGARLPAGPLREGLGRLNSVDFIVAAEDGAGLTAPHAYLQLAADQCHALHQHETKPLSAFSHQPVIAVAGIGHPERFFKQLQAAGLNLETRVFPDHHAYTAQDFAGMGDALILMTEKDAVKCRGFGLKNAWYLPVTAKLHTVAQGPSIASQLIDRLTQQKGSSQ